MSIAALYLCFSVDAPWYAVYLSRSVLRLLASVIYVSLRFVSARFEQCPGYAVGRIVSFKSRRPLSVCAV
jgi:hypothetical protein